MTRAKPTVKAQFKPSVSLIIDYIMLVNLFIDL